MKSIHPTRPFRLLQLLLACLMAVTTGATVRAQESTSGGRASAASEVGELQEVLVTATRREERLQDVPISVSAISQEKIDSQGLHTIDDLTRLTPGVAFQRNGVSSSGNYNDEGSDINIRGVDSTAGTSTTGIYIDDTPIQTRHVGFGSINAFPALFDLDRVEVLRGPQGTQFGAGAEGGVVRFIAPEPSVHAASGYFRADGSRTQDGGASYEGGVAFGAPLVADTLAFRASVSWRMDGGWVDRSNYTLAPPGAAGSPTGALNPIPTASGITEHNANYSETTTARLAVKWRVNDQLEITPSVYFQRLLIHDTAAYWMYLSRNDDGVYRNGNALRNPSDDPLTLSSIKIKLDLGFAELFSNTAYYDRNQKAKSDYTQYLRATWTLFGQLANTFPAPGDQGFATFEDKQRNFYQELRLASTDANARFVWSGGLFFSHLKEDEPENIFDQTLNQEIINFTAGTPGATSLCVPTVPALACPGGQISTGPYETIVDKQYAVFGEANYKVTPSLKATVGLRISKLDYNGSFKATGPFNGAAIAQQLNGSETPVTPKFVMAWQPDRDDLAYVSVSKGFRPGGPNVGVGALCATSLSALGINAAPPQFTSDSLWSYELGAKNSFFDHSLQVNSSLFYVDWSNIQQNVYLPSCGQQFTGNLGKARSDGGDIDVLYRPTEALTLSFAAAYTDARLTKTSCAGSLVLNGTHCVGGGTTAAPIASSGDALLGAPWSITASVEYHLPVWQDRTPYVRFDYQYQSAQRSLLQNQDSRNALFDLTLPGLPVVSNLNARAGLRFSGFDVSVYANNLGNAHPLLFESRDIAAPTDLLYFGRGVRPRTVGLTGTYRF